MQPQPYHPDLSLNIFVGELILYLHLKTHLIIHLTIPPSYYSQSTGGPKINKGSTMTSPIIFIQPENHLVSNHFTHKRGKFQPTSKIRGTA
jgi:hypothetical protein